MFGPYHFSKVAKHLASKERGVIEDNFSITVDYQYCTGVLFDDGTAVVHAYGCGGPISDVTPDCNYWSSFYILPTPCQSHDQLKAKATCQVCGRVKGKEWRAS